MKIQRTGKPDNPDSQVTIKPDNSNNNQPDNPPPSLPVKSKPRELKPALSKSSGKVDIAIALEMRFKKGKTLQEIADHFGVTTSAVSQRLKNFMTILQDPEALKAWTNTKTEILSAVEIKLVSQLLNADKLKGASLNNVAYALQNVFNMNRLEQDKSTANIAHALRFEVLKPEDEQEPEPVQ